MPSGVTVAVVGALDVAKELGKKGTSSDVTLFNVVHDDLAVTIVEPTQFPDKYSALLTALAMADQCVLVVSELNRTVAEAIATVDTAELPTTIVLGTAVGDGEVSKILKGSRLESAPRTPLDFPKLRDLVESWHAPQVDGSVLVPIDHAFPVKGVGAVALGVVRRGTLRAHEKLRLYTTPKSVDVRSIQVHDVDRKEAACGERVGLALKGVEADELSRGQVLAPEGALREGTQLAGAPLVKCRYYRGDAGPGAALHAAIGLQVVPAELDELSASGVRFTTDRPVAYEPGSSAFLIDLGVPTGPRLVGRTVLRSTA
jgi:selenocysteine-specific translation elongation factor